MHTAFSPTTAPGSPRTVDRTQFSLTLRTNETAYCPACGRQLNHAATSIRYGIAWCTPCFSSEDDYPLRIAMMITCQPAVGHLSTAKGVTFYTPRLIKPGSYPSLVDRLTGGPGHDDIPAFGEPWPRWIPPHAEVIIYALQFHLLHPELLICDENALNPRLNKNALTVLQHGTR